MAWGTQVHRSMHQRVSSANPQSLNNITVPRTPAHLFFHSLSRARKRRKKKREIQREIQKKSTSSALQYDETLVITTLRKRLEQLFSCIIARREREKERKRKKAIARERARVEFRSFRAPFILFFSCIFVTASKMTKKSKNFSSIFEPNI